MSAAEPTRYLGKYRGTVVSNVDPLRQGRLTALVPDVLGEMPSGWAMPCVPVGGQSTGLLALPAIGAGVWIEFEGGDPGYPIWTGAWWGSASELPPAANLVPPGLAGLVYATQLGHALVISDAPGPAGGLILKSAGGAMITINDTGIIISNGQGASLTLTGPTVNVNMGALTVT